MTLNEILGWSGGGILLLATLIQIAPIKLNPWSAIAKAIGKAVNGDVQKSVDNVRKDITEMRQDIAEVNATMDEREAINCRRRILIFDDELLHDVKHSKEHFDQILRDMAYYDNYWRTHPNFDNGKTSAAEEHIKKVNQKCQEEHSYL